MFDVAGIGDLVGMPFKPRGRGPDAYDCWGLAMEVYRRRGIGLPDFAYGDDLEITVLNELIRGNKRLIVEIDRPEPWCLVGFSLIPAYEHHIGVSLPDGRRFIHARRRHRIIISRFNDQAWKRRIRGFYRWVG